MKTQIIMNDIVSAALNRVQDESYDIADSMFNLEIYIHRQIDNCTTPEEDLEALRTIFQLRELFVALSGSKDPHDYGFITTKKK